MRRRSVLNVVSVVAALGLAGAAWAAPIHVSYQVERKPFKSEAEATDALHFALYADAACTQEIAGTDHFVGDTALDYFLDKRQRVRGAPTGVVGCHAGPGAWGVFYQLVRDDDPLDPVH